MFAKEEEGATNVQHHEFIHIQDLKRRGKSCLNSDKMQFLKPERSKCANTFSCGMRYFLIVKYMYKHISVEPHFSLNGFDYGRDVNSNSLIKLVSP